MVNSFCSPNSLCFSPSFPRTLMLGVQALDSCWQIAVIGNPVNNSCCFHLQISICLGILPTWLKRLCLVLCEEPEECLDNATFHKTNSFIIWHLTWCQPYGITGGDSSLQSTRPCGWLIRVTCSDVSTSWEALHQVNDGNENLTGT